MSHECPIGLAKLTKMLVPSVWEEGHAAADESVPGCISVLLSARASWPDALLPDALLLVEDVNSLDQSGVSTSPSRSRRRQLSPHNRCSRNKRRNRRNRSTLVVSCAEL